MQKNTFWKTLGITVFAGVLSTFAILPYVMTLQADLIAKLLIPFPVLIFVQSVQNIVLLSLLVFLGLKMGEKVKLGFKFLPDFIEKKKLKTSFSKEIQNAVFWGVIAGVLIIAGDNLFAGLISFPTPVSTPPVWQGFLASFYGGIFEEILMRLFVMTFFVWLFFKFSKSHKEWIYWGGIILAAIIFGLGHLPTALSIMPATTLVIARIIVLNGIGGIIFGWIYWKRGLEMAMVAHFTTDIVLHVLLPFLK